MRKIFTIPFPKIRPAALLALLLSPAMVRAESAGQLTIHPDDLLMIFICGLLIVISLVLLYLIFALRTFLDYAKPKTPVEPLFGGVFKSLTDSVPIEREEEIMTDHVYDGIRELDNNLPPWWKYLFYATIVFSGVYLYYYHMGDGKLQIEEYEHEVFLAQAQRGAVSEDDESLNETNVTMADSEGILKGEKIYVQNCAPCHGKIGEGGVGPNLTDEYWLNGGGIRNVFRVIKHGVPQKGMIPWKSQMSAKQMQDVASYIMTLEGTNPPNAKEAQGEKYVPEAEEAVAEIADAVNELTDESSVKQTN